MKNLIYIFLSVLGLSLMYSCDDVTNFLDKAPGVDVTEDTIFSSKNQVETFVATTYYYGVMSDLANWDTRDKSDCMTAAATDECEIFYSWYWVQAAWNNAGMSATNTGDRRFFTYWKAIRCANTLIERIDTAPFDDPVYKKQVMGEAMFIRALNNFELFRKYGGVPIVKKRFAPADDLNVPRSSVKDVVEFIVEDCNEAINNLPAADQYPTSLRGRATRAAAMALKSRTLLYAASKTFNTEKPYLDLGKNNSLICYGNYDANRWKLAVDAALELLNEAKQSGIKLVTDQGITKNYQYAWEVNDNSEIILAEKSKWAMAIWHFPWSPFSPNGAGYWVTYNFTKLYERKDGTKQPWNDNGGTDLMDIYANMDPRFKQTITYQWQRFNDDYPELDLSVNGKNRPNGGGCEGPLSHKPLPYSVKATGPVTAFPNGVIFRLPEAYLNYAEALNEFHQTPPEEAYSALDSIRLRSGMPKIPRGLSQDEFRKKVRNERAIELAFEGHRLYDIRRWEIADEGIMKGKMYGIHIYTSPGTKNCSYMPYVFEVRSFNLAMYRYPFPQNEIDKGYLIQNPGY